jgi:hypothetical protein
MVRAKPCWGREKLPWGRGRVSLGRLPQIGNNTGTPPRTDREGSAKRSASK